MPIRIQTLGGLRALVNGAELQSFGSQRLRASLLVYLAVERVATRDSLQAMFWPEAAPDSASGRLKQTVYALRQDLGEECIETVGQELRCGSIVESDALDFDQAIRGGRSDLAAALYKGPFLNGVHLAESNSFESWIDTCRTRYARQFRKACRAVIDARIAVGDIDGAVAAAQSWVQPDPLDDEAQHRLIELLAAASGRNDALRQFEAYSRLLESEGLQPLDQTRELVAALEQETAGTVYPAIRQNSERDSARPSPHELPSAPRRWSYRRLQIAFAVAAPLLLATVSVKLLSGGRTGHIDIDDNLYLLLPFTPLTPDTGLERIGRELSQIVAGNINGLGDLRTVDQTIAVSDGMQDISSATAKEQAELARKLGAGRVIAGTMSRVGQRVRLDIQMATSERRGSSTHASVSASFEDLQALADSATRVLLPSIWAAGGEPTPMLDAAVRTPSLPALRAFLDAEKAVVDYRWKDALAFYRNAFAADSAFWLASWREIQLHSFHEGIRLDSTRMSALRAHQAALPPIDRLLLNATNDTLSVMFARFDKILPYEARWSWLAHLHAAESEVHYGPLHGRTEIDAAAEFDRALGQNPRLIPALYHRFVIALNDRDTATARVFVNVLPSIPDSALMEYRCNGCDYALHLRFLHDLASSGGHGNPALLDSVARNAAKTGWPRASLPGFFGFGAAAVNAYQRTLDYASHNNDWSAWLAWQIALGWAERGAIDSAFVTLDRFVAKTPGPAPAYYAQVFAVTAYWYDLVDANHAVRFSVAAHHAGNLLGGQRQAEILWLDGIVAAKQRNKAALGDAVRKLRALLDRTGVLAPSLDLIQQRLIDQNRVRGDSLAQLVFRIAESKYAGFADDYIPITPVLRSAAAKFLLEDGDTAKALKVLTWHESWLGGLREATEWLAGPIYFQRAVLDDTHANSAMARRNYKRFLERYDLPDSKFLPNISYARSALQRLSPADREHKDRRR